MTRQTVILWGPGGVGEYVLRYLQTQPELEPTKRQPPATAGVPVKSPLPFEENPHAGCRVAACNGPIVCSRPWDREFE